MKRSVNEISTENDQGLPNKKINTEHGPETPIKNNLENLLSELTAEKKYSVNYVQNSNKDKVTTQESGTYLSNENEDKSSHGNVNSIPGINTNEYLETKDNKEVILPENIKSVIKENVEELKNLLRNDEKFCIDIIKLLVNDYAWPRHAGDLFSNHYSDLIKQCAIEYKQWPKYVIQVREIIATLFNISRADEVELILNTIEELNLPKIPKTYDVLATLYQKEIGVQFDPKNNYRIELDPEFELECINYLAGQGSGDQDDF